MRHLLLGVREFRRNVRDRYAETFRKLAEGQKPDTVAIACSDSRMSPMEFGPTDPGAVFVVRVVGNLIPPCAAGPASRAPGVGAAIEYALAKLPVDDFVICGHSGCGAMHALLDGHVPPGAPHLAAWLELGRSAMAGLPPKPAGLSPEDHLSQQNVLRQLDHLRTYPGVKERELDGRLRLHGWWFDIANADMLDFDPAERRFMPMDEERIARLLDRPDCPRG